MTKELLIRLFMFLAAICAVVFGVLTMSFDIIIPGAMFFSASAVFICFGVLTILEKDRSNLKHWKFLSISSFALAAITAAIAVIEVVL